MDFIQNFDKFSGMRTTNDFAEYSKFLGRTGALLIFQRETESRHSTVKWQGLDLKYALLGFGFAFFDIEVVENPERRHERIISVFFNNFKNFTSSALRSVVTK